MTEAEWQACTDPTPMLEFLEGKASDRKSRLFAVACCRHISHVTTDIRVEAVLEVAEKVAEGQVPAMGEVHDVAQKKAFDALNDAQRGSSSRMAAKAAIHTSFHVWTPSIALIVAQDARDAKFAADGVRRRVEGRCQARLLRDIFGNPFRPATADPAWLTSTVVALAEGIYADRAFDRMPILADALQDAGCDRDDILSHCRDTSLTHVRGCWVVDLLLGKSDFPGLMNSVLAYNILVGHGARWLNGAVIDRIGVVGCLNNATEVKMSIKRVSDGQMCDVAI